MKELSIRLRIGKKLLYNHDKSTAYKAVFSINGPNDLKTPIKIKSRDQPITICTLLKSLVMITNPLWRESFVVSLTRVSNSTYLRTQLMVYGLAGYYAIKEEKPSPIDNLQNRKWTTPQWSPPTTPFAVSTNKITSLPKHNQQTNTNPFLSQVQEELNKHREEFKKQQLHNTNFDFRIGNLEATTHRIDSNVDRILDLMENNSKSKAPRTTKNMQCDSETSPYLTSLHTNGDDDL